MEKKIILVGGGNIGREALSYYGTENVEYYFDNRQNGQELYGKKIINFTQLKEYHKDYTIVIAVGKQDYILQLERQLDEADIPYEIYVQSRLEQEGLNKLKQEYFGKKIPDKYANEIEYMIRVGGAKMLPYSFVHKYIPESYHVQYDEKAQMNYYLHKDKKMYFPKKYGYKQCQKYLATLLAEQDEQSPHEYFDQNHKVTSSDVFLDIGSAEGFIALDVVDVAKAVYLFECDDDWIEALEKTFAPYKNKVTIVKKMVSDQESNNMIQIDELFSDTDEHLFMKVDIEGYEDRFLMGARKTLCKNNVKLSLCTYHKHGDAFFFEAYLKNLGYQIEFTNGYIFRMWNDKEFTKGVLKARK